MATKLLKGYALEYFIRVLLLHNSFTQVNPDSNYLVYRSGAGLMIQGLGQSHNADVLVNPPIQIPFYYPSRLLIECKCHNEPLGLPHVRNVFGLREDINGFDVIDKEILKNRRNNRRVSLNLFDYDRYQYQVALASVSGFKVTAQEFAHIHRIPLLSFQSLIFEDIRNAITALEESDMETSTKDLIIEHLQGKSIDENLLSSIVQLKNFINTVENFVQRSKIGMLDDGTLLFLIKPFETISNFHHYSDGVTLHWSNESKYWILDNYGEQYYFELPEKLFKIWAKSNNIREDAINLKQHYFKNIIIFEQGDFGPEIKTLHLSSRFIREAFSAIGE